MTDVGGLLECRDRCRYDVGRYRYRSAEPARDVSTDGAESQRARETESQRARSQESKRIREPESQSETSKRPGGGGRRPIGCRGTDLDCRQPKWRRIQKNNFEIIQNLLKLKKIMKIQKKEFGAKKWAFRISC